LSNRSEGRRRRRVVAENRRDRRDGPGRQATPYPASTLSKSPTARSWTRGWRRERSGTTGSGSAGRLARAAPAPRRRARRGSGGRPALWCRPRRRCREGGSRGHLRPGEDVCV